MKKLIYTLLILSLSVNISCKKTIDKKLYKKVNSLTNEFSVTKDTTYLIEAYKLIKNSDEFKKYGLTKNNLRIFSPVFFNLKKFDELDSLASQINTDDVKFKEFIRLSHLIIQYSKYKYKKDTIQSNRYIKKIIDANYKYLTKNPQDSLRYLDYFMFKKKIYPDHVLINELDSIKKRGFISNFFYEYILQEIKSNSF